MILPKNRLIVNRINNTGAASVLGQVVRHDPLTTGQYIACNADYTDAFGVVAQAGIPNGSYVPIVVVGVAQVLFATDQTPVAGLWYSVDPDQEGRAGFPAESGYGQGICMALDDASGAGQLVSCFVLPSKTADIYGGGGG